jgi:sulfite reductase (NADPH) flavoprotein alpha-component
MSEVLAIHPIDAQRLSDLDRLSQGLDAAALNWASGYLAGLARARAVAAAGPASAGTAEARSEATLRATILYATQTGNGRRLAERLGRAAESAGLAARVVGASDYGLRELASERLLFIVASTHGDGDPPDDLRSLLGELNGRRAPRLERLGFSVLALGDSSYPRFCETGRFLDARLEALGARRLAPRQDCDVDYEGAAAAWIARSVEMLRENLAEAGAPRLALVTSLRSTAPPATREQPLQLEVVTNQRITGRDGSRDVRHLELAAPEGRLDYEPGDAIGILHTNPQASVARLLELTGLDGNTAVEHEGRTLPLAQWLENEREVTRLTRPFLEAHARRTTDASLDGMLRSDGTARLRTALRDWQVADLLLAHPGAWDAAALVAALRPATPRLYSIASSRMAVGDEAHLTVALVDYRRGGEQRHGAASWFLASRGPGTSLRAFIEPNPRFRLPKDGSRDVVMIGPGTGVAPFRAFVQERAESAATGRNWLFFGARHLDSEFLYQAEWLAALKRGSLHRLDAAFSRDQAERIHVQQRIREQGAQLFDWLEGGAHVYVCGDAQRMAHDVHAALVDVVRVHGRRDADAAAAYVDGLFASRRYARDVY